MDMTAWVKAGTKESVGVITDFVDPALTEFNKQLIDKYRQSLRPSLSPSLLSALTSSLTLSPVDIPWVETKCGYACSGASEVSAFASVQSTDPLCLATFYLFRPRLILQGRLPVELLN